jgi:hypothetical protein
MHKTITPTNILTLALCLTICLSLAIHTPLQAKIHDYTKKNELGEFVTQGVINEFNDYGPYKGNTFQVYNGSTQRIYIRIGYIFYNGGDCEGDCEYTGFILDPGQTGKIHKHTYCNPINVSGHFYTQDNVVKGDIPNPIRKTYINDRGILQWDVTDEGILYKGREVAPGVWKQGSARYRSSPC